MARKKKSSARASRAVGGLRGPQWHDSVPHLFQQALALHKQGQLDEAQAAYLKVLAQNDRHADALHLLGLIAHQKGQPQPALDLMSKALEIEPGLGLAYYNRAAVLQDLQRFEDALIDYDRAIAIKPDHAEAHYNRGVVLQELGRREDAVASYDRALAIRSDHAGACFNKGIALQDLKRPEEALTSFERAIAIDADDAEAWHNRGVVLQELGRMGDALTSFDRAIALAPNHDEAYNHRGIALHALKRLDDALRSFERAISLRPDYVEAHYNRGLALQELKRLEDAVDSYDRAIGLRPSHADAYNNRGLALHELKRSDEALASYDRAIALAPDHVDVHSNRGIALQELSRLDEALASYDRAIALDPDHVEAHANKSLALLLMGNFEAGWPLYEWRWKRKEWPPRRDIGVVEWTGGSVDGSLLVLSEQGLGDHIFYSGMLDDLQQRVPSITVSLDPRLIPLFRRSFGKCRFVSNTPAAIHECLESDDTIKAHIYMGSLGRYLRASRQDFATVKDRYLIACDERTHRLREQLASDGDLICGISWLSKNEHFGSHKSLGLADLAPLLSLEGCRWVNLQYGDTTAAQDALRKDTGLVLTNIPEVDNFNDIDGLAALVNACDIIVTVSNTTAHLAAALGKPVLIILPAGNGLLHYWQIDRDDSPWYPSAKLYRQIKGGDWTEVVARVATDLRHSAYAAKAGSLR